VRQFVCGLQLKKQKKSEEDFEKKMDKIFLAAAEKAFNALLDQLSKNPSQILYWILAVATLALVGHTKKVFRKMVVKGWRFVKRLCGCRDCLGRSPQNP
jgi:hypothetical protein